MGSSDVGAVMLRPTAVRVLAALTWVLMALYLGWTLLADPPAGLRFAPVAALVSAVVYAMFWRPGVAVDDDSVTLVNVLRDIRIPFSQMRSVQTRYAMQVETTGRTYTAWAAPAPGRTSSMSLSRREAVGVELLGADLKQGVSASAAPNTDSGAAAMLVRHRWALYDERVAEQAGSGDGSAPAEALGEPVTARWAIGVVAALVVCAAASALTLLL